MSSYTSAPTITADEFATLSARQWQAVQLDDGWAVIHEPNQTVSTMPAGLTFRAAFTFYPQRPQGHQLADETGAKVVREAILRQS